MHNAAATPPRAAPIPLGAGSLLLAPDAGGPPAPPLALVPMLWALDALPRRRATQADVRRWVAEHGRDLRDADRAALLRYAATCTAWEDRFHAARSRWGDARDYTTRPAVNVRLNPYEHQLGQALVAAGLPIEAQVGVSKDGGSRRGGWYGSYWLDFVHRDRAHMLLLDIELDGKYHRTDAGVERDGLRNDRLRRRGWYVVRIPSTALHHRLALQAISVTLVDYAACHRQAVILGRIGETALADAFAALDGAPSAPRHAALRQNTRGVMISDRDTAERMTARLPLPQRRLAPALRSIAIVLVVLLLVAFLVVVLAQGR